MATKTRSVRAAQSAVTVSTPPPENRRPKSKFTEAEKQGLLQNFDLEVEDKVKYFRSMLAQTLASYRMREETEILSIPRDFRRMTLGELEDKWDGSWADTLSRIKAEKFEVEQRKREEEEEKERDEAIKGKRKRTVAPSGESSPDRSKKNPRREEPAIRSVRKPPARTTSLASSKRTNRSVASSSKPASTLPQEHIFNPTLLPTSFGSSKSRGIPTPLSKSNKERLRAKNAPQPEASVTETDEEGLTDGDLPKKDNTPTSKMSSKSMKKRAPSLIFRQSLAPGIVATLNPITPGQSTTPSANDPDGVELSTVHLSDGRAISFNPFSLTPGRIDLELEEGGVSKEEKERVKAQVHKECVGRLQERMEKFFNLHAGGS